MNYQKKRIKIIVISPSRHVKGFCREIESVGSVDYCENISYSKLLKKINAYHVIFCNPNRPFSLDKRLLKEAKNLKLIVTTSTGTNHIDCLYARRRNIKIISLKDDLEVLRYLTATAELAFGLTLAIVRNIVPSFLDIRKNHWRPFKFVGQQLNGMTAGIIGYGRLGRMYCRFAKAFFKKVLVCDPFVRVKDRKLKQVSFDTLIKNVDVISLHVHLNDETYHLINDRVIKKMKRGVYLINTSRGEVVDSRSLIKGLKSGQIRAAGVDVVEHEYVEDKQRNPLVRYVKRHDNLIITPHLGGVTTKSLYDGIMHSVKKLKKISGAILTDNTKNDYYK